MDEISRQTEQVLCEIGLLERKDNIAGELSYGQQRALEIGLTIATDPETHPSGRAHGRYVLGGDPGSGETDPAGHGRKDVNHR